MVDLQLIKCRPMSFIDLNTNFKRPRWWVVSILGWVVSGIAPVSGQEPRLSDESFFETKIRPVLIEHCYECHGPEANPAEANLRLDSLAGMKKGGDNGSLFSGTSAEQSLLLSAVQYDQFQMPPAGKLPNEIIADFQRWIEEGAQVPDSFLEPAADTAPIKVGIDWEHARKHWAFLPIRNDDIPKVSKPEWKGHPIDEFIFESLERNSIEPVALADRPALMRRLYLNLIGLPPTPKEVKAFSEDTDPDAYEMLIDRLLKSPKYGERWGRHWLDVVRYADSNGADENHPYPHAWRYRNYVIDAFNRDLPFDEFVVEQLAGDLLPVTDELESRNRRLTATSFLAMGIKIDAEQDPEKKRADIIDEQLDALGRAFMGITIGCARCHDHKFDPVPTSDYYGLSGVLRSTQLQNHPLLSPEATQVAEQMEMVDSEIKQHESQELQRIRELAVTHASAYASAGEKVVEWERLRQSTELNRRLSATFVGEQILPVGDISKIQNFAFQGVWREAESFDRGEAAIDKDSYGEEIGIVSDKGGGTTWVEYDFELPESGIYQVEFRYAAEQPRPGKLSINGVMVHDQSMGQVTGGWFPKTQKWIVEGRFIFKKGLNTIRFEVTPNMSHLDQWIVARVEEGEYPVKDTERDLSRLDSPEVIAEQSNLELNILLAWAACLGQQKEEEMPPLDRLTESLTAEEGPLSNVSRATAYFSPAKTEKLEQLRGKKSELTARLEELQAPKIMAVAEGDIADAAIFTRGNHRTSGEVVPRRFLTIVDGVKQQSYPPDQSGRLQMAKSIASSRNPLTARVIANRVWRWHFGRGLVSTTDNFGIQGEAPTHPELLDFLANYLVRKDWSIKALQKLIVTSRVYQLDSRPSANQIERDPVNRWYGYWPSRPMEAETLRDSLLQLAGRLDLSTGESTVENVVTANPSPSDLQKNRDYFESFNQRSVYLPIVRTNLFNFYGLFDFPNPAVPKGNRDATTVPTQALFLLNSEWIRRLAEEWSDRVRTQFAEDHKRVEQIYLAALGRLPEPAEVDESLAFVSQSSEGWLNLCHSMFLLNEFLYIE